MRQPDWESIYLRILDDMGYSRDEDEATVRILRAVTMNSDLVDPDDVMQLFEERATVFGDAPCLEDDVRMCTPTGTLIASGSCVHRLVDIGIWPDVIVTDLDGDIDSQLEASSRGALTFIHAHGDNQDLVRRFAGLFRGPVILTTQSTPENTVFNFGGFTDGDRAVCIAQEMGCRTILLEGFDFDDPNPKKDSDPEKKLRKLGWAREIIGSIQGVSIQSPRNEV